MLRIENLFEKEQRAWINRRVKFWCRLYFVSSIVRKKIRCQIFKRESKSGQSSTRHGPPLEVSSEALRYGCLCPATLLASVEEIVKTSLFHFLFLRTLSRERSKYWRRIRIFPFSCLVPQKKKDQKYLSVLFPPTCNRHLPVKVRQESREHRLGATF